MERKKFLTSIGSGAAFALTLGCFNSCLREEINLTDPSDLNSNTETLNQGGNNSQTVSNPDTAALSTNILFTIDLTSSEASKLARKGGYIIKNKVVVAKNMNGDYVAATVICSHELLKKVQFKNNEFYCSEHGARFDLTGKGLNKDGRKGLKIYETSLNGNLLHILS